MKKILFIVFSILILLAAILINPQAEVVQRADYEQYLDKGHLQNSQKELSSRIQFWEQKLEAAPRNFVFQKKLAALYAASFKLSGNIGQLQRSDSLFQIVNHRIPGQVGVLQSLAANAITRHAFREAENYIRQAWAIGEKKFSSSLILADVALERGNLLEAKILLKNTASNAHFDYLIREVKLYDQMDKLDEAVRCMEKAAVLAKAAGDSSIIYWSLSNLADMYGHQGKVKRSYQTYLEALGYNPAGLYALKGIAWVAFSKDKNTAEAKSILEFLQSIHPVPDYDLFLADIAAYEKDTVAEAKHHKAFLESASKKAYGNMYRSYVASLESKAEALKIARAEVKERPHPMSYSLLAWAAFQNGEHDKAIEILEKHVLGQTGEPVALYHAGIILKESGAPQAAKVQLSAAQEASFELGPVVAADIEGLLKQL